MTKPVGIPVATFRWHPGYASLLGFALLAAYHGWKLGGPQILTDSPRYLHLEQHLFDPAAWEPGDLWYWSYAALLRLTGGPDYLWGIVALQLAAGAASLWLLVQTATRWGGARAGLVAGLFLLAWVDYQAFHWKIYTESLFTSLGFVLVVWLANRSLRIHTPPHPPLAGGELPHAGGLAPLFVEEGMGEVIGFATLLLVTLFLRPTSIGLVATLGVWLAWQLPGRWRYAALGLGAVAGLLLLNRMLAGFQVVETNAQGVVLFGYHGLCVPRPADWVHPDYAGSPPLVVFVQSWWDYPGWNLRLGLAKLGMFLGNVRPFYSTAHNVYLVAVLAPLYGLAVQGWRRLAASRRCPIGLYLGLQAGIIMLTAADWDGRFFHPMVPLLALLAGVGVGQRLGEGQA